MASNRITYVFTAKDEGVKRTAQETGASLDALAKKAENFTTKLKNADFTPYDSAMKRLQRGQFGGAESGVSASMAKTRAEMALTGREAVQLSYQLNDVFVSLMGGQKPLMVMVQQGSQISQIFGGVGGTVSRLAPMLLRLSPAIGAAAAAFELFSKIKLGDETAKSINETAIAADKAGTDVKTLDGYLTSLIGRNVKDTDLLSALDSLRKQAFASKDAWKKAQDEYRKAVAEAKLTGGDTTKIKPVEAPDDVFKKLGYDTRSFSGDTGALLTDIQNKFASLGTAVEKTNFARLIEDNFSRPIAELSQKAPSQIGAINAAFDSIVPRISKAQEAAAAAEQKSADAVNEISKRLDEQAGAAFMPLAKSFNEFRLQWIIDHERQIDGYIDFLRARSKDASDLFDILRGDKKAKINSPTIARVVDNASAFSTIFEMAKFATGKEVGKLFGVADKNASPSGLKKNDGNLNDQVLAKPTQTLGAVETETRNATDAHTTSLKFKTQALNEAADATRKLTFAEIQSYPQGQGMGGVSSAKDSGKRTKNGSTILDNGWTLNNSPKYFPTEADYEAKAQKYWADQKDIGDKARSDYMAKGGKATDLGANDQVAIYQQANEAAQQLVATTAQVATNSKETATTWSTLQTATSTVKEMISGITSPDLSGLLDQLAKASEYAAKIASSISSNAQKTSSDSFKTTEKGYATGGLVRGPGTSRSDSILARLSNNEFVFNARAVSALGVSSLSALNAGVSPADAFGLANAAIAAPGFADGGFVGGYSPNGGLSAVSGGVADAGGSPVHLHFSDGTSIGPMMASKQIVDALARHSAANRAARTAKTPSRVG